MDGNRVMTVQLIVEKSSEYAITALKGYLLVRNGEVNLGEAIWEL